MSEFIAVVVLLLTCAVVFFLLGVLAGYHSGHRDGRREAVDEMQPSYSAMMVELAKVPNQYKDFNYSDNPKDDIAFGRMMLQAINKRISERSAEQE